MPRVPYSPVPEVGPSDQGAPSLRENAPIEAFGGGTAAAIGALGQTVSHAGDEIFARALAIQQLNNETEAREADAKYMMAAGDIHAKYNALEGKARVDAFPKYSQDLQDLRVHFRNSLSNPMAQKLYDSSSLSTMSRSIFNGAGAAATAQKEYAHTSINAQHDLLVKSVFDNPKDDFGFRQAITQNHESAATRAALLPGGASPERIELLTKQGDSTIAANRILGMARNEPYLASLLLKQYKDEGLLFGKDYETVSNKVQSLTQSVGTNIIANKVLDRYLLPDGNYSKSAADMQAEAVKLATETYPDDPKMASSAAAVFDHNYGMKQYVKHQDEVAVGQEVQNWVVKGVPSVDLLPPDLVKRMSPKQIREYPLQANSYSRAINTQTDEVAKQKWLGVAQTDPDKFVSTDFLREPGLSIPVRKQMMELQRKVTADGDPRVTRAMGWIKGANPQILDDLQVTGPSKDRDTGNQFIGALHEAIQAYQDTNGKPPDEKTVVKEIFPAITRQITQKGIFWDSKSPFFQAPVPEAYKTKFLELSPTATENEIRTSYSRQMFDQFFKSQKASKDQARVGQ